MYKKAFLIFFSIGTLGAAFAQEEKRDCFVYVNGRWMEEQKITSCSGKDMSWLTPSSDQTSCLSGTYKKLTEDECQDRCDDIENTKNTKEAYCGVTCGPRFMRRTCLRAIRVDRVRCYHGYSNYITGKTIE